MKSRSADVFAGYFWSAGGVAAATACFWLARASMGTYVSTGQAYLLYLPVVIACAVRFGFGPAVLGAALSFFAWNFFFLPPAFTLLVHNPGDWPSLAVFLVAAVTTAQLAAQTRVQANEARAREAEIATLFEASEVINREVEATRLLSALANQVQRLCHATRCVVFRYDSRNTVNLTNTSPLQPVAGTGEDMHVIGREGADAARIRQAAADAWEQDRVTGLHEGLPTPGIFVPLRAADARVGVLHVGPREDGRPFSRTDERLILTLANHAATVIAREGLAEQAAQAAALREADVLKDTLLSLVSHELRTPLAAIKASATGLLQPAARWDEASRTEALAAIDREADRLTGLVNNLLDLSRLEAGVWTPAKDWCDLTDILSTVLDRLPDGITARVEATLSPDLPLVRADYTQIALVLENLLTNAAKYAPSGPIRVTVSPTGTEAGQSPAGVMVAVRDFGPGITAGEEEQLFVRFFRGARHRDGSIHGTGLGLALCDAIIRAHGGQVRAANAPAGEPHGAVFSFSLPVE